ncbi:folate-binding protein YgfZ [Corynebacterium sp. CNCTC7651]|uniref:CAF17-like 4Fe-4S cluster assembly/insertion protein YgfZ n=1 Tax=Corynebacterium sp. CNCTC7651 TaxID=2815361 RepID=UPI001F1962F4|nr:folate-binding protein [Corynebacterium sp. CNCTC7651]UIZ91836.1 folate-binding protein YgfZ [Corynebacterium sp. CNCTC7651]
MTYRSALLDLPGAAALEGESPLDAAGVALHYGDPLGEQRRLAQRAGLVDRSQRTVVTVSGPDAPVFLNNLLSQKLDNAAPGFAGAALDLDMQGHILHHADVFYDGTTFYLDVPAAQGQSLLDYLRRMIFWSDVEVEEADLAIVTLLGPAGLPADLPGALWTREVPWLEGFVRYDVWLPRPQLKEAAEQWVARGGDMTGLLAFTAQRVRAGEPELGADLDDKSIPHEVPRLITRTGGPAGAAAPWPGAVHLYKGCYRGQETVARVENLGRSPRLLVMLQLDGSSPTEPAPGTTITSSGRKVGRLGTVVHDADYGPIALALIKRSALPAPGQPGAQLDIDGTAATVDPDSLPLFEGEKAGKVAVEKLRRGLGPA